MWKWAAVAGEAPQAGLEGSGRMCVGSEKVGPRGEVKRRAVGTLPCVTACVCVSIGRWREKKNVYKCTKQTYFYGHKFAFVGRGAIRVVVRLCVWLYWKHCDIAYSLQDGQKERFYFCTSLNRSKETVVYFQIWMAVFFNAWTRAHWWAKEPRNNARDDIVKKRRTREDKTLQHAKAK